MLPVINVTANPTFTLPGTCKDQATGNGRRSIKKSIRMFRMVPAIEHRDVIASAVTILGSQNEATGQHSNAATKVSTTVQTMMKPISAKQTMRWLSVNRMMRGKQHPAK